jgi:SAM-dependent methyltransferase
LLEHGDSAAVCELFSRLIVEAESLQLSHIFLSGEDICSAVSLRGINRLKSAVASKFDEVNIILVLRRKYDYLLSHYNHSLRHHATPITIRDFHDFMNFSPRRTLDRWSAAFGASVEPFVYDSSPGDKQFLERFFFDVLGVTIGDDILNAGASVNASFDLLSALIVNEVIKPLGALDVTDVNLAYLDSFRLQRGKMPLLERDTAVHLNEIFQDDDWAITDLSDLTAQPGEAKILDADSARVYIKSIANFLICLRALYCAHDEKESLSRGDIVAAYRAFLSRDPSRDELDRVARAKKSMPALRQMIVESPEFRRAYRESLNVAELNLPRLNVNTEASDGDAQDMFVHLQGRWTNLGSDRPHWSVLSNSRFEGSITPNLEDEFYGTGEKEFNDFKAMISRSGRSVDDICRLVDFGCGLGRFTLNAAREIPAIVGLDFSATHIEMAQAAAARHGIHNVEWVVRKDFAPCDVGAYDAWYSRIVLQHNPPPLISRWLREGLGGLSPRGIAMFQVPTYSVNYSFAPEDYLREMDEKADIEMHCIPQGEVLKIIADMGCRLLELREDNAVDIPRYWVSNTFLVERL